MQIKAEQAGEAMMDALNPLAVDAMLPMLFKQFEEHRWQTKLGAVKMFARLAETSAKAVSTLLPTIVIKLMEVSQDPKPSIKEEAVKALKACCSVIDNADVYPLIDSIISANLNPDTEGESCLDKLVGTTYVAAVDEPTLALIMPILMRGLKVRGNVNMQRKSAVVVDTMYKLVNNPADAAFFAPDLVATLTKNIDEISVPEVRSKTEEALITVKVTLGEFEAVKVDCSPVEVEAVLSEILTGNAYNSDEVSQWVAQVTAPLFASARTRVNDMVVPYLKAIVSEAEAIINGERFLEEGAKKFGAGVEEEEEVDHDDLAVLCDCSFSLAYGNRVLLHNTKLKLKRGKCYGLIGPNGAGKSTLMRSIAAGMVEGFPKEIRSVYVECDVSAAHAEVSCVDFIHMDLPERTKDEIAAQMTAVGFKEDLMWGPVGALSGGWRMRLALSRAMLKEPELLLLDEPTNHVDVHGVAWLTKYVQDLSGKEISSMIVSHDSAFLDAVAQDMCHYEKNRKLKVYKGNLSEFVKIMPEAKAYYELASENIAFSFPDPGMLEGVTSRTKAPPLSSPASLLPRPRPPLLRRRGRPSRRPQISPPHPTSPHQGAHQDEGRLLQVPHARGQHAQPDQRAGVDGVARRGHRRQRRRQVHPHQADGRRDRAQRGRGRADHRAPPQHAAGVRRAARLPPHREPPGADAGQLHRVALRRRHGPRGPRLQPPRPHRGGGAARRQEAGPGRHAALAPQGQEGARVRGVLVRPQGGRRDAVDEQGHAAALQVDRQRRQEEAGVRLRGRADQADDGRRRAHRL